MRYAIALVIAALLIAAVVLYARWTLAGVKSRIRARVREMQRWANCLRPWK